MKIILDTSFLLSCIKERVDFFETERFGKLGLLKPVLKELENLTLKGKGDDKRAAGLVLEIIEKNWEKFEVIKSDENYADKAIIDYIDKNKRDITVATLDRELKRKIRKKVRVLTLKARKKIQYE